jgi:peptidoglycan hydrolase-like protein with peptidoglycan-binding domain
MDGSNISINLQVAEHSNPVAELRRQYDTIRSKLGYRSFSLIEGPDVRELKSKLHELGYYRKDAGDDEFSAQLREPSGRVFDVAAAEAVDAFRKEHQLPVASDGLGHARGIVDDEFIDALRSAIIQQRKQGNTKTEGASRQSSS